VGVDESPLEGRGEIRDETREDEEEFFLTYLINILYRFEAAPTRFFATFYRKNGPKLEKSLDMKEEVCIIYR
jgi:hypothetical protein